jgi:hypothetical protein
LALISSPFLGSPARAQAPADPVRRVAPGGLPGAEDDELAELMNSPAPTNAAAAWDGPAAPAPRVELGLGETIFESLFGDVYAEGRWRPISLGTFFSEGWLEPWASGPAGGDGLTPRHGWLGAFDGVFFRLWLTTFSYTNGLRTSFGGNAYGGDFNIYLPFSRRFNLLIDAPFVRGNGTADPYTGYRSSFGDFVVTPRFMLSETERTTQIFSMDVRTPTGQKANFGNVMALTPRYEFWTNPVGPWVVRGAASVFVPLNKAETPAQTAFTGGLAVGRYFRPHDVPFGDLVFYAACNFRVPLDGGWRTSYVGVGPGTRFHIAKNYFFLHYWEFPVTGARPDNFIMQVALLKVF